MLEKQVARPLYMRTGCMFVPQLVINFRYYAAVRFLFGRLVYTICIVLRAWIGHVWPELTGPLLAGASHFWPELMQFWAGANWEIFVGGHFWPELTRQFLPVASWVTVWFLLFGYVSGTPSDSMIKPCMPSFHRSAVKLTATLHVFVTGSP